MKNKINNNNIYFGRIYFRQKFKNRERRKKGKMESENQAVPGSSHSIDDDDSMNSNSKEMFMAKFDDDEFYEARDNLEFGVGDDEQAEEDEEDYYDVSPVEVLAHIVTTETTRVLTDEINGGFQNFIQQRRQYFQVLSYHIINILLREKRR